MDIPNQYNKVTIGFQLSEALSGLSSLLASAEHGALKDFTDEVKLSIGLGFVLGHLCLAWHTRSMGPEEVGRFTYDGRDIMLSSVPNWGGRFELVGNTVIHPGVDRSIYRRHVLNVDTICEHLRSAQTELDGLTNRINGGDFDKWDIDTFASCFQRVLCKMCLAWHCRYMNAAEIRLLDSFVINELQHWLPHWAWEPGIQLVHIADQTP